MRLLRTKETSWLQGALKPADIPPVYKRGNRGPGKGYSLPYFEEKPEVASREKKKRRSSAVWGRFAEVEEEWVPPLLGWVRAGLWWRGGGGGQECVDRFGVPPRVEITYEHSEECGDPSVVKQPRMGLPLFRNGEQPNPTPKRWITGDSRDLGAPLRCAVKRGAALGASPCEPNMQNGELLSLLPLVKVKIKILFPFNLQCLSHPHSNSSSLQNHLGKLHQQAKEFSSKREDQSHFYSSINM